MRHLHVWSGGALFFVTAGCFQSGQNETELGSTEQAGTAWDLGAIPVPSGASYLWRKMLPPGGLGCTTGCGLQITSADTCVDSVRVTRDHYYPKSRQGPNWIVGDRCADAYIPASGAYPGAPSATQVFEGPAHPDRVSNSWLAARNFPVRMKGESLASFRSRARIAVYYNETDLGLGRVLGCSTFTDTNIDTGADLPEPGIACYVVNHGAAFNDSTAGSTPPFRSLKDAVHDRNTKNTVVISYLPSLVQKYGAGFGVQFAAFAPYRNTSGDLGGQPGEITNVAALDNMGARPIPQICTTCHGGTVQPPMECWDPNEPQAVNDLKCISGNTCDSTTGHCRGEYLAFNARFLPVNLFSAQFDTQAPYNLSSQQEIFRFINNLPYESDQSRGGENTLLTSRQKDWLRAIYGTPGGSGNGAGTPLSTTLKRIPPATTATNTVPPAWKGYSANGIASEDLYRYAVVPYCGSCHLALETGSFMESYGQFTTRQNVLPTVGNACTAVPSDAAAVQILNNTCVGCHQGAVAQSGAPPHDWRNLQEVKNHAAMIKERINLPKGAPGRMPFAGLSGADLVTMNNWLNCYASQGWINNVTGYGGRLKTATTGGDSPSWQVGFSMPHAQPSLAKFWGAWLTADGTLSGTRFPKWTTSGTPHALLDPGGAPYRSAKQFLFNAVEGPGSNPSPFNGCSDGTNRLASSCGTVVNGMSRSGRYCATGNVCVDGCGQDINGGDDVECPGSDSVLVSQPNRQECSVWQAGVVGTCRSCGRLGQPKCTRLANPASGCLEGVAVGPAGSQICGCTNNGHCPAWSGSSIGNTCDLATNTCVGCTSTTCGGLTCRAMGTAPADPTVARSECILPQSGSGVSPYADYWLESNPIVHVAPPVLGLNQTIEDTFANSISATAPTHTEYWYQVTAPPVGKKLALSLQTYAANDNKISLAIYEGNGTATPLEIASTRGHATRAGNGGGQDPFNDSTLRTKNMSQWAAPPTGMNYQTLAIVRRSGYTAGSYFVRVLNEDKLAGPGAGGWNGRFTLRTSVQNVSNAMTSAGARTIFDNHENTAVGPYYGGAVDGSEPMISWQAGGNWNLGKRGVWVRLAPEQKGHVWTPNDDESRVTLRLFPYEPVGSALNGVLRMQLFASGYHGVQGNQVPDILSPIGTPTPLPPASPVLSFNLSSLCPVQALSCDVVWAYVFLESGSGKAFTLQVGDPGYLDHNWLNPDTLY